MLKKSYLFGLLSTVCFAQEEQETEVIFENLPPEILKIHVSRHLTPAEIKGLPLAGIEGRVNYSEYPIHILSIEDLKKFHGENQCAFLHWEVTPEQQESLDLSKFKSITLYAISLSPRFIEAVRNNPNCKVTILTHGANVTKFMRGEFTGEQAHRVQPQPIHQAQGLRRAHQLFGQASVLDAQPINHAPHHDLDDVLELLALPRVDMDIEDASHVETPEATSPTYQFPENLTITDILNTLSIESQHTVNETWATIQRGFFTNQTIKTDASRDGLICYILANTIGNELISEMNKWALYDLICAIYYLPARDISPDNLKSIAKFANNFSSRMSKDRVDPRHPDVFNDFLKNPNFIVQVAKTSLQLKQMITYIAPENLNPYITIITNALMSKHAIDDVKDYFIATKPNESRTYERFPDATYTWANYLRFKELKQAGLIDILSTYQPALSKILTDSTLTVEQLNKIKTGFPGVTGWTITLINEALLNPEEVRNTINVLQKLDLADWFSQICLRTTLLSIGKFDDETITFLNRWQTSEERFKLAVSTANAKALGAFI